MRTFQPSEPPPTDLQAHIDRVLAEGARPIDPAQAQRLLKQLQRVEPAARAALAQAQSMSASSFDACLNALR
jgi:hypothetical protein